MSRRFNSSVHLQNSPLRLSGITTDFQAAEALHPDGREAVVHDVDGDAWQVLVAAFTSLGPVAFGTAIPPRDPHRPGGKAAQLLSPLE